jgi:hypothetical protein
MGITEATCPKCGMDDSQGGRNGHGNRLLAGTIWKSLRCAGRAPSPGLSGACLHALLAPSCDEVVNKGIRVGVRQVKKVSCEDCFFRKNMLCALDLDEACPTFRPDHPEGLRPPQQLRFVFRQERRRQAAWAFPDAQEQAALHA